MKSPCRFTAVFLTVSGVCLAAVLGCMSVPKEPVPDENVWALLSKGDNRARELFLGKVDVHEADSQGRSPLHYAAKLEDPYLAAFFISLGAQVDAQDNSLQTPLGISVERGDATVARVLVAARADIHKPAKDGISPAKIAIRRGSAVLRAILTPATIKSVNAEGKTILHLATEAGNMQAVSIILEFAESSASDTGLLAQKDNRGANALDSALSRPDSLKHIEAAEKLILAGAFSENPIYSYFSPAVRSANYNVRKTDGLAPLHVAAHEGHEGMIAFLIKKKADINIKNSSGATPLHEAARSGNLRVIEMIINQGAEINAQDGKGNSALHIGIPPRDHQEAINLFLAHGANPNLRDEHGESPLHILVTLNRKPEVVQALLGGRADVSIRNVDGKTALFFAVQENRLRLIPLLLAYGSDIFAADNSGVTPFDRAMAMRGPVLTSLITPETIHQSDNAGNTILHTAVKHRGEAALIGYILDQQALVNARNKEGDTALHIAVRMNQRETGEFLLSRGGDIFSTNSAGETPLYLALTHPSGILPWMFNSQTITAKDGLGNSILHYVAQWKLDRYIPFVIQRGISTEAANATGETPLFVAVKHDGPSTVRTLLQSRANMNARDSLGNSVLHAAVRWNAKNAALALIDSGIDINAHSLNGTTPLHDAVNLGITDIASLLIDQGANLEVRDADGNTPLMEAVRAGFPLSMELLAEKGADTMTRNSRGDTPLHIAVVMNRSDLVSPLLRMGVSIHARDTRNKTPFQLSLAESPNMVSILLTKDRINSADDFGNSALHIALQEKASPAVIKVIINQGARQNAVDSNGRTPLRLAVDMGAWESAKLLADSSSDPFSTAGDGKTPAEIAIARGRDGIRAVFSGKAVSARDASGNTVLHYAARQGNPEAIALLLDLGANKSVKNIAAESPADIANRWNHHENAALLLN